MNASSDVAYSEFTSGYYYQTPIQPTPFNTEYNNRYSAIKIDLNFTSLYESTSSTVLNFTHIVFSVPDPTYELTINEIVILEESYEPTTQDGSFDGRIWQYTEIESFDADETPEDDYYQVSLTNTPLFYPDSEWLEYLNIYDEDGNYYTAGITGNDHQLHFNPTNDTFTWNPSFNQFPEYFGMEFQEPLIIEPNKTLYIEYVTNTSWAEPILIDVENVDLSSIRMIYDYNYLLKPEHYDWYSNLFGVDHSYESISYSLKDETEYEVVQYYYEEFTVYSNSSQYIHTFDIGDLIFEDDFVNISLYKVIGLTTTFGTEILNDNADFTVVFNESTNELNITDLNSADGLLDTFDQIMAIVNFSYGPISKYSEIYMKDTFNLTYLSDIKDTFYNYLEVDYQYSAESGSVLFSESSESITSETTLLEPIDYNRNPDMSNANKKLIGYTSELYDHFEIYKDESSIIYTADIDMDGEPDYKQTIDVNKDGVIDIVRYGIDDPENPNEIYWYTIIQDFKNQEISVSRELQEEQRTKWFDIEDTLFAHYDFNLGKLVKIVLSLPLLPLHIAKMLLPDVDYWAQKSTQQLINKEEYTQTSYYSIKSDADRDGFADSQIDFESKKTGVYYEITEYKKTILAAKFQDVFTYLAEYVERSIVSLFTGVTEDSVFNEELKSEYLESGNFSQANIIVQVNALTLRATYRKFTENTTTSFIDSFEQSSITVIDWNEGEIEEQRIYRDVFENYEVEDLESFFTDVSTEHKVTNIETGQEYSVLFDPELPYAHPANITWETGTWGPDNIPTQFDSLQVINFIDKEDSYTTNAFEPKIPIHIRIPNRFSLYNDYGKTSRAQVDDNGWVEFEVEGVLITPPGGVYYTSDIESFASGTAKTSGSYFYVDSDQNGYYETVYVVKYSRTNRFGAPVYDVMSIGFNNDGIHDFAPYEKLRTTVTSVSDFSNLASESTQFGTDWIYNFNKLKDIALLGEDESPLDKYNLKAKDTLFEVFKLISQSEQNSKFSELFYEIRHKAYNKAWDIYRTKLLADIAEQVFMSAVASFVSATIIAITVTTGTPLAHLAYFAVYTLMTKFSIDMKLKEAESQSRSQTFTPISIEQRDPVSLNERSVADRVGLKDSMAAALLGHPGGYYTAVSGGEPGNMYTAEALVSPPNYARMLGAFSFGFLGLLWENFQDMGESNPDTYTALDFDDMNLDYRHLTSELSSFNKYPNYVYKNTENVFHPYTQSYANTLGFLETKVRKISNNQLDTIIPTTIDGRPEYRFINGTTQGLTLPLSVLYKPVVLSKERYGKIQPTPGHLVITVQTKDYNNTKGINPYTLTHVEQLVGYKAKIPLINKEFEYPIQYISIDMLKQLGILPIYFARDIIINKSYYAIEDGNLYFTKSLEEIVSEQYSEFETELQQADLFLTTIYFDIHIFFDRFVPDNTTETNSLALAQATSYAIMDYFNQYTYAEVTANMISEIAYTETLTFWSTLISAPLVFLGSWAIMGTKTFLAQAEVGTVKALLTQFAGQFIMAPIKEVFQEIIEDGFKEAIAENFVDLIGGTEDLGFWLSSLWTSKREVGGALSQISLGKVEGKTSLGSVLSIASARLSGDTEVKNAILTQMKQELAQKTQEYQQKRAEMSTWQKLMNAGTFRIIVMTVASLFFGGSSFLALLGLNKALKTTANMAPRIYGEAKARSHANRKDGIIKAYGENNFYENLKNMENQMKKPSNIDGEALNSIFRSLQKLSTTTETNIAPSIAGAPRINPNPKSVQRNLLAEKFNKIANFENFGNVDSDKSFKERWLTQTDGPGGSISLIHEFSVKKDISILSLFKNLEIDVMDYSIAINSKIVDSENFDTILKPQDQLLLAPISKGRKPDPSSVRDDISGEITESSIDAEEGAFALYDQIVRKALHAELFGLEFEKPTKPLKKTELNLDKVARAKTFLESILYNGKKVIVDGAFNWEVLTVLKEKFVKGEEFNWEEGLIADVAVFYMGDKNIISNVNKVEKEVENENVVENTIMDDSHNEFENLYFRISNEIIKIYNDPSTQIPKDLSDIFGDVLEIKNINRPIPMYKLSKLLGMGGNFFSDTMQRYERYVARRELGERTKAPMIKFSSFAANIQPSLSKVLGEDVAREIVNEYMTSNGYRTGMLYSLYSFLYEKTGIAYKVAEFSNIIFGDKEKAITLLKTPNPSVKDLDQLWTLEYLVSKMKPNAKLKFMPSEAVLEDLVFESKKVIRREFIRQTRSLSPVAVNMVLDSLYILSEKHGFYSFRKFSKQVTHSRISDYLSHYVFGPGKNPGDWFPRRLLEVLAGEGISSDHMAVQWTELFAETRGISFLDFDFYLNKFKLLSGDRVSDTAVVKSGSQEHHMALTITYAMTGGRSWMTGEKISFDNALLHHVLHDENGKTLYGVDHENKYSNFACLNGKPNLNGDIENNRAERRFERQYWEDKFLDMWRMFKDGNFKGAIEHWNNYNPQYQRDFLRERHSRRYLDNWLEKI